MYYNLTKKQRILTSLVLIGTVAVCMFAVFYFTSVTTLAAGDIFEAVGDKFKQIYTSIGIVVTSLAGVALAVCAFKWILGTDPNSTKMAKQWMLNIIIGLAVYWLAFLIINTVKSITSGYGPEILNQP